MRLLNIKYIAAFVFLLFSQTVYLQQGRENVDSTTGGLIEEEAINLEQVGGDKQLKQSKTCLASKVSFSLVNQSLAEGLKLISKSTNVNFAYDDRILDIDGITHLADNEPLHSVLDKMLEPYDISYFEYEPGKVALAKKTKIDERTGGVKGVIKDESGEVLMGANVMIKELQIGCASDLKGNYIIRNIKPGQYNLEVSFVGYEKSTRKINIQAGMIIEINFRLKQSAFQIGGIEVVGTTDLIPKDAATKTIIQSGEIEHYQASSLKDVLDLVPGVQKTDNPGLAKTSQIAVRGDEGDALSAFGTLIVVDGTPMSNNANLQFERLTGSKFGTSNIGRGVDLRTIPADNIESIEVITGLPSVRYGDVTAGVINVQTKIGPAPHRLKVKDNPDTREANFGGGIMLGESGLSYNVNLAQSERDIRKTGDEYVRLTGQAVFSSVLWDNAMTMNNKFNFQTIYDEEEPKGDVQMTRNYNRGFTLGASSWGKYKPIDEVSSIDYNVFVTMRRENTMKSSLKQSDLRILPTGDTISTYLGKVETRGVEWTIGGRLEWNRVFYTGDIIHKILIGTDPQYNANTGEGVVFDTLFSYYGVESGKRPYRFDDIPGQFLVNFYAEDKMTGNFIFDFSLMFGVRYEMYRPYKFNLAGLWGDGNLIESHQGTYFNPRLNLMIFLSENNQVRLNAGTTSKSPSMSLIYPVDEVFTWRNPIDSTISYFRFTRRVPDLKGYREAQYEISYDHKFSNMIGTSVSAYYKRRGNEPKSQTQPAFTFAVLDDKVYVYYLGNRSISENLGGTESKGIEFALRTAKVRPLNMEFQVVGSYNFIKNWRGGYYYSSTPDTARGQYPNYIVPDVPTDTLYGWTYAPTNHNWSDRFQLNYYVKYTCAPLGLWVTLRAEQLVFERNQSLDRAPQDFDKLNETQKIQYLFDREIRRKPNKWLFNLNISKSLFAGAEVSFYVNNFLDDPAIRTYNSTPTNLTEEIRNPSLTYGLEFSMMIDKFFGN